MCMLEILTFTAAFRRNLFRKFFMVHVASMDNNVVRLFYTHVNSYIELFVQFFFSFLIKIWNKNFFKSSFGLGLKFLLNKHSFISFSFKL